MITKGMIETGTTFLQKSTQKSRTQKTVSPEYSTTLLTTNEELTTQETTQKQTTAAKIDPSQRPTSATSSVTDGKFNLFT